MTNGAGTPLKNMIGARPLVVFFVVIYIVLTVGRLDDAAALLAAPVWTAKLTSVELPLPAGKAELPGLDLGVTLPQLFLFAPLVLVGLQLLVVHDLRTKPAPRHAPLGLLYAFVPLLGLLYVAWRLAPFVAARPLGEVVATGSAAFATGLHAALMVVAATAVAQVTARRSAIAAFCASAAGLALILLALGTRAISDGLWLASGDAAGALSVIAPAILILGAFWLAFLLAADRVLAPFGFRPWVPLGILKRRRRSVASNLGRGDLMLIRIAAPCFLFLAATVVFAAPRPLDLSGETLALGVPAVAPEPAMVLAYALHENTRPPEAWSSAERHAWRNARGLTLTRYRLEGANFSEAQLYRVDFGDANLRGAIFDGAKIPGGSFAGACVSRASFRGADLTGAAFGVGGFIEGEPPCTIRVAQAEQTDQAATSPPPKPIDFTRAKLHFATFPLMDPSWTPPPEEFVSCEAQPFPPVIFSDAELYYSDLTCRNLSSVPMHAVRFDGADLRGARLPVFDQENQPKSFQRADLKGATLSGNLEGVDFRGADLRRATLKNTQLSGALFDCADIREAIFDGSTYSPAAFAKAIMFQQQEPGAKAMREHFENIKQRARTDLVESPFSETLSSWQDCPGIGLPGDRQ